MNETPTQVAGALPVATREQISRWLDGDIAAHEIELAMTTLSRDDGRYCWAEMHFVGDCIRGLEPTASGCAERVRAAIAAEPAIVAPAGRRLRREADAQVHRQRGVAAAMHSIGRGGRAWATAAAVAAVGFVGTVVYKEQISPPGQVAVAPAATGVSAVSTRPSPEFNAYLQAHQESADLSSLSPMRQYLRPAVITQGQ
ncbi:MAG: hypothetical protein JNL19_14750 [Burkholderiales bacterium]|nr:hypothetical protein [Burkholderiales bacterium]